MIELSLRAKYDIEQYLVFFPFPGIVLGTPYVEVEVLVGEDPTPWTFAGLPVAKDNLVAVVIAGGVPGCVYRVICTALVDGEEFTFTSKVAVKESTSPSPGGSSVPPTAEGVTTPPYPLFILDSICTKFSAIDASIFENPSDSVEVELYALDVIRRDVLQSYYNPPDEIDVTFAALDATRRPILLVYQNPPDSVDISFFALDATRKDVLIIYYNYAPEGIDVTFTALDATRT